MYCTTFGRSGLQTNCSQLTSPTTDESVLPEGGVLEDLPTLEQVPTTPPPLFGRNVESIQPTEIIEQPLTTTPPLFGKNIPQGGEFEILQDSETPPMFGQAAPE